MFEASCESLIVCEWRHISGDIAQYHIYTLCMCVCLFVHAHNRDGTIIVTYCCTETTREVYIRILHFNSHS